MKIANKKQDVAIKITMILFITLALTIGYVYIKTSPSIDNAKDIIDFSKIYYVWMLKAFDNVKDITGNAINQDWNVNGNESG
ncbi:MAG: hypothetical protein AABY22_27640 [Nanoarchaeota archaeon]